MAAVFSRLPMRVRCATQRDHVFHPEMNYSQTQLDQLDRLTERWVVDHLQKGKTSKKDKELVTLEIFPGRYLFVEKGSNRGGHWSSPASEHPPCLRPGLSRARCGFPLCRVPDG